MKTSLLCLTAALALLGCDRSSKPQPKPPEPGKPLVVPKPNFDNTPAAPTATSTAPQASEPDGAAPKSTPAADTPAEPDPTKITLAGASAPKPASWTWTKPTMQFRSAQYIVPARDGTGDAAEFIVSIFTGGDGGAIDSNIARWAGQFRTAEGKTAEPAVTKKTVDGIEITLVELKGSYQGMFSSGPKLNTTQLGAIIETDAGTTFLRLIGPEKTVEAHRAEWDEVVGGIKKGG